MKIVKFLLKALAIVAIAIVVIVLTLPLWIGPVVTTSANAIVPQITGAPFHLGQFKLNPYNGKLVIGDVQVANPEGCGYSEKDAITLGSLVVDIRPMSLLSDVIEVELISVNDLFVDYESSQGTNNIDHLMLNAGVKEPEEELKVEVEVEGEGIRSEVKVKGEGGKVVECTGDQCELKEVAVEAESEEPGKRVKIARIEVGDVKVKLGIIPIMLPAFSITGIGEASNGVSFETVYDDISSEVMKQLSALVDLTKLGKEKLMDLGNEALKQSDKAVKEVQKGLNSLFKNVTDSFK